MKKNRNFDKKRKNKLKRKTRRTENFKLRLASIMSRREIEQRLKTEFSYLDIDGEILFYLKQLKFHL